MEKKIVWTNFDIQSYPQGDLVLNTSRVHGFKPYKVSDDYIANRTLCNQFSLYIDENYKQRWGDLIKENLPEEPHGIVCKNCLKIFKRKD